MVSHEKTGCPGLGILGRDRLNCHDIRVPGVGWNELQTIVYSNRQGLELMQNYLSRKGGI